MIHVLGRARAAVRALTERARRRRSGAVIHVSMPLYVRDARGHLIGFEATPQAPVSWATVRALIALDDPRDPAECRMLHNGRLLRSRRSLQASGVRPGDAVDVVSVKAGYDPVVTRSWRGRL